MCELCIKHGEGKKWYQVMQNYSKELFYQKKREQYMMDFLTKNMKATPIQLDRLSMVKGKMPFAYRFIRQIGTGIMKQNHFGQVLPLEDAEMVIDIVQTITRLPCVCRGISRGNKNARYCMGLGVDIAGLLRDIPELKSSLEVLNANDAKKLLREFDQQGLVHSVWTFKTPYIGGLCNCDYDCVAYRAQVSKDLLQVMFKGEYIADINQEQCAGCRNCVKMCQFGAIEYSNLQRKCNINRMKCYGCGVCRNGCYKEAISMIDRNKFPELAGIW